MKGLLRICGAIDRVSTVIGRAVSWLVLLTVLISAGNAIVRKVVGVSSNAWLEVQWYLFSAVFLLLAAFTLLRNAHVRIDFVAARLAPRTRAWVDVVGIVLFLAPLCVMLIWMSVPIVVEAWRVGEISPNAGGLIRWPVYALLPAGMLLLLVQSLSELVKRIAFLRGQAPDPLADREEAPG